MPKHGKILTYRILKACKQRSAGWLANCQHRFALIGRKQGFVCQSRGDNDISPDAKLLALLFCRAGA